MRKVEDSRYKSLYEKGVVGREQYDRFLTSASALDSTVQSNRAAVENAEAAVLAAKAALENSEATVKADRAAVENARIQLGYCFIYSPMEGRTGSLIVQKGNVVKADDAHLVVINQITPIYVTFSVPGNLPGSKNTWPRDQSRGFLQKKHRRKAPSPLGHRGQQHRRLAFGNPKQGGLWPPIRQCGSDTGDAVNVSLSCPRRSRPVSGDSILLLNRPFCRIAACRCGAA
jgi:biotin carboxyl carrier protein